MKHTTVKFILGVIFLFLLAMPYIWNVVIFSNWPPGHKPDTAP